MHTGTDEFLLLELTENGEHEEETRDEYNVERVLLGMVEIEMLCNMTLKERRIYREKGINSQVLI
jgi:hypothetical protein